MSASGVPLRHPERYADQSSSLARFIDRRSFQTEIRWMISP
jgi:hypothetical protein